MNTNDSLEKLVDVAMKPKKTKKIKLNVCPECGGKMGWYGVRTEMVAYDHEIDEEGQITEQVDFEILNNPSTDYEEEAYRCFDCEADWSDIDDLKKAWGGKGK